jgi:hypothetical protein
MAGDDNVLDFVREKAEMVSRSLAREWQRNIDNGDDLWTALEHALDEK